MKGLSFACGLVVALVALAAPFQLLANDYFVLSEDSAIIAKPDDPAFGKTILAYTQSELLPAQTYTFGGPSYNSLLDDVTTNVPDLQKFIESGKSVAQDAVKQAQAKAGELRPAELNSQYAFRLLPGRPARLARRADRVEDRQTRGQDVNARLSGSRNVGLGCGASGCSNGSCNGTACGAGGACNSGACNNGLQFSGARTVQLPSNSCGGGSCGGTAQQSLAPINFTGERVVQLPGNSCGSGSCGSGSCGSGSCGGGRNTLRIGRFR